MKSFLPYRGTLGCVACLTALVAACVPAEMTTESGGTISLTPMPLLDLDSSSARLAVSGIAVSEDGYVAFASPYAQADEQITVIDTTGRVVSRFGRFGEGPGEIWSPFSVFVEGSDVLVYDTGPLRISRFNLDGAYIGEYPTGPIHVPVGIVGDSIDYFNVMNASANRVPLGGSDAGRLLVSPLDSFATELIGLSSEGVWRGTFSSSPEGVILGDGVSYVLREYAGDTIRTFGRDVPSRDTAIRNAAGSPNPGYFGFGSVAFDSDGRLWIAVLEDDAGYFDVFEDYRFVQRLAADCPPAYANSISIAGSWLAQMCLTEQPTEEVDLRLYRISG